MNLPHSTVFLAEIQLLDMNGPAFLTFYAVVLLGLTFWSVLRARKALDRHQDTRYFPELTDPYSLAYLSAGAGRVAQLVVVRLLELGEIEWIADGDQPRIARKSSKPNPQLVEFERWMLQIAGSQGSRGIPLQEAYQKILPYTRAFEVKLAALGLRPTERERAKASAAAAIPLFILLGLGILKIVVGISRDKPVGFLVLFLVITFVILLFVSRATGRLTTKGQEFLNQKRADYRKRRENFDRNQPAGVEHVCLGFALIGAAALAEIEGFTEIYQHLDSKPCASGEASGGGCSSGCGSDTGGGGSDSGGGDSGCGGCGGCGGGD